MQPNFSIEIPEKLNKNRADIALSELIPDLSRTRIQDLIVMGHVFLNNSRMTSQKHLVKIGDQFTVYIPEVESSELVPENIPLDIVYEDNDIVVINKPVGLVAHPAPGNYTGTLVQALLYHCGDSLKGISGVRYPGIVHRLDKNTSGLMVAAKTEQAHHHLSDQLKARTLKRVYHCLCWGIFQEEKGTINAPITQSPYERQKMRVIFYGKEAITHYQVLKTFQNQVSLVECRLETGRTHQIRVHMSHMKHSLLGDPLYGKGNKGLDRLIKDLENSWGDTRQALHAVELELIHPTKSEKMSFQCGYPQDLLDLMYKLDQGNKGDQAG